MIRVFVVRCESGVEYQTCLEFSDDCALKISAFVHHPMESDAISNPILAAVQTAWQVWEKGDFRAIEHRNFIMHWITKLCRILRWQRSPEYNIFA
jgi:hypothetical protein